MATHSQPVHQEVWESPERFDTILREPTMKRVDTSQVFSEPLRSIKTATLESTLKTTKEAIDEMKTWLRTGITPDGTRMVTGESWQWFLDYYQYTGGEDDTPMPVDYYYWQAPYYAHIGEIPLVMMHAQVRMPDGTHFAADRLSKRTKMMKNLDIMAAKRIEVENRLDAEFVEQAIKDFRANPLRKRGLKSKILGD